MIISIVEKISEKKSWIIVWSEMQIFLTQFWWFLPHHFTFEVTWKNFPRLIEGYFFHLAAKALT